MAKDRVPILGDIPILGALFGQTSRSKRRFELIFQITPRVIRNLKTVAEMTIEFREGLVNAYDYILRQEAEREALLERRRKERMSPPPPSPPD